jgi:hypothetical protein
MMMTMNKNHQSTKNANSSFLLPLLPSSPPLLLSSFPSRSLRLAGGWGAAIWTPGTNGGKCRGRRTWRQ